jgi:hypothetical protein
MKILFIGNNAVLPDYLHDSVFHGLRELGGDSVVDANKLWYLYKDSNLFNLLIFYKTKAEPSLS